MTAAGFRQAVRSGRPLLGAFVKTASHQSLELLTRGGQDFAVIDAEHAPFDLAGLDAMAAVAAASGFPVLVRPPTLEAAYIGQVLDMGFAGVLAPHAGTLAAAERVLDAARYDCGRRGFSPSTRAGGFGAADAGAFRKSADAATSLWLQIEDAEALDALDAVAALAELDCLFIGRADLAASLGVARQDDAKVVDAVHKTIAAGRRHGRAVGLYVSSVDEIADFATLGASIFVCGSDQSFVLAQARANRRAFDAIEKAR